MKKALKERAIELRKQGLSYNEILLQIDVAKSSLSLWLRDIKLTKEQKNRLKKKKESTNWKNRPHELRRECGKKGGKKGGKITQKLHGKKVIKNLIHPSLMANLCYRKDELPIKEKLEALTGRKFKKEGINNKFFDFTDDTYLIEYTTDHTKGLKEAIDRLSSVQTKRVKILITNLSRLGPIRRKRCIDINLLDIKDIEKGIWLKDKILGRGEIG